MSKLYFHDRKHLGQALFLLGALLVSFVHAGEVTLDEVSRAASNWLNRGVHSFRPTGSVLEVERVKAPSGLTLFHVAKLSDGGFVVLSPDRRITPIIAFSSSGQDFTDDADSPLLKILSRDLAGRREALETSSARTLSLAPSEKDGDCSAEERWERLLNPPPRPLHNGRDQVEDLRVPALVETRWSQGTAGGKPCFNYYTPKNYLCGCVATAYAQILRYHRHPTEPVIPGTFACEVDGKSVNLTMLGGVYEWDQMPVFPDGQMTDRQRQAIGKLCYDIGVLCNSGYDHIGAYSVSSKFIGEGKSERLHYTSAVEWWNNDSSRIPPSILEKGMLSNFDAGMPVALGVPGHLTVADGYGFVDRALYIHVNMGWFGRDNAWYALPNVAGLNGLVTFVYNIFPTQRGSVLSGRVLDADGEPANQITVTAREAGSQSTWQTRSNERGIYAFILPPEKNYQVSAEGGSAVRTLFLGTCRSGFHPGASIGNHWGADLSTTKGLRTETLIWNGGNGEKWENGSASTNWLTTDGHPTGWHPGADALFTSGGEVVIAPEGVTARSLTLENPAPFTLSGGPLTLVRLAQITATNSADVRIAVPLSGTNGLRVVQGRTLLFDSTFLTSAEQRVFPDTRLSDIGRMDGFFAGKSVDHPDWSIPCQEEIQADGSRSIQFQLADDRYTKCVKVHFFQRGNDVAARAVWAKYKDGLDQVGTDMEMDSSNGSTLATRPDQAGYGIARLKATLRTGSLAITVPTRFSGELKILGGRLELADGATLNPSGFFSDPVDNNGTLSLCSSWQSFGGSIFGKGKIEVGGDSTSARLLHEPCLPAGPGAQAVTVARNRSLSDLAGATGEPVGRWMGETGREYLSLFPTWTQSDRSRKTLHLQIESEDNFTKGLVIEFIQQGSDIAARAIRAYSQPGNKLGLISDGDAAPVAGSPDAEGYGVRNLELSFSCGAAVFRRRCEWQGGLALSDNGLVLTLGGEGLPGIGTLETRRGGEIRYLYRAESPPTLWIRSGGILNLKNGETFTSAESQKALFLENGTLVNAPLSDQGNGNYANRITLSDSSRITGGPILIGAPGEEARLKVTGTGVSRQEAGYRLMGRGPLTLDIDDTTGDSGADLILAAPLTARNESETIVNKRGSGTLLIQGAPFVPGIFRIDSGAVRLDLPASSEIRMGSLEIKGNARLLCGADDRIETSTLTLEQGSVLELGVGPQGGTSFTGQNINLPGVGATTIKITASTPPIRGLWFTLIAGMNLTPDQLDRFTLDLSRSPGLQGSLSIEDGDLRFTVTQSPALQNTLLWQGADGNWDSVAENRVWQRPDGTPSAFSQESDIRFALPASTHARVEIAPDIRPGILLDESAGALTLGGAKLLGNALFLKTGTGVLTLDSLGFENQPIQILEGRLKLGTAPNTQDALGASSTPIEVRGNGTLDLNAPEGDPLPYGKEVLIHGSGENGQGIIVNSGRGNGRGFSRLKALGNTILSGPAGWKIKGIQGRGELSAPKRATLTVKGPMRPDAEIEAQDTDVTLGTLELREGGRFRITGSGNLDIDTLTLKDGSTGSFGNLSAPLAFPIHLEGTSLQGLANVGGTVEFAGPISLESGSTLALSARENGGTSRYTGGIEGTGAAIRMTGGSHLFTSDLAVDRVDLASGSLKFGDPERDNTAGKRLPGQIALSENTVLAFTSRSQEALYRDLRIEGRNAILIPGFSRDNSLSRFENLTVDLADRGLMKMGQSPADSRSRVRLDSGSTVTVETLEIQDSGSAGEVDLQIGPSATLTILGESDNACRIGHWPSQKPGRVTVDGGTLHLPNARPQIGWDAWDSALHLNSGLLKAPKGINIRTHSWSDSTYKGHFAMNSGTLQIGEGIDTALDSPQLPLLYLNGGRVESLSDWSVKLWLPTLFGSPSGRDGRLEIDTREHSISLPTPLRGGSDVRIFGNGSLSAASGVLGGPTGHWTLENRGGADLRGASAFAGGMTVGEGAEVRVDIGSMDHYATVETLSHRTRGVPSPNQADRPSPLLGYRYHTGLLLEHGLPNSVLTITGQFKTEMRDVHFFCMADEVTGILKVGEYEHCNTWTENKRRESAFLNGPHWHNFRLIVHNNGEALATSPSVWKRAGMVVGWKRGGNDAPGTDPAKYKPFDGSSLELRPRPSATLRRVANTYGNPGNWMERSDFNDFETLGSLRETLHSHSWVKGCGSVNEITGWFRVDQAADWRFKGSYDDQIALWVDGKLLFQTARWDDVRESETIPLTRGLHAFRVRFMDTSSNTGQAWGKPDDQVLWYRIGGGNYTPFNEESLVITADPYGFIGGELALASGALLTNDASSPCSVTGTLRGEGTLEGLFRLEGAVWEVRCKAGRLQPERVAFENADPDALRDVGKIKVLFDAKPLLARYPITPALGLPGDAESLSERVEASLPDGTVLDLIPGIDPDGRLVLTNPHVETGTLILIR